MCRQTCEGCQLYQDSLGGLIDAALKLRDGQTVIEVSAVGGRWDQPPLDKGAQAILYYGEESVSAKGKTPIEAMAAALEQARGTT